MNNLVETEIEGVGRVLPDDGPFGRVLLPKAVNAWELPLDVLPEALRRLTLPQGSRDPKVHRP